MKGLRSWVPALRVARRETVRGRGRSILVLVMINMRKPSIPQGLYFGLLALTIANIAVAVFWSPAHA